MARNKSEKQMAAKRRNRAAEPWDDFSVGSIWIDAAKGEAYVCTDMTANRAQWASIGSGNQ